MQRIAALFILAAALSPACVTFESPAGTSISSEPPGARVVIDGEDSGFVTPCYLRLHKGEDYDVRVELDGFQTAKFELDQSTSFYTVPWSDGYTVPHAFRFPLFLEARDLFVPFRIDTRTHPGRVFVRLQPEEAPPEAE